ncbi:SDR family NAD(P)-dependent oxidoreductase [Tissierella praeacuta]|uniref:NAD(P)-dependent dehydrogenase, short-chain alcohol dehydrogenase family n=1 Tax=Tissierella praeacuta DSM 18095 TaxID=1123404 RepID=A0A1M4VK31_9FIRM|nr:SDR family NAD(P)-dependent oxidoreductase [Tissierella praeacuta]HAE92259.1 KR domain-containing protein [Tissierella sp.]MBU5255416.1 SDR family oxidoreductase [Tissierella praeacuta]TCU79276.1 NAD(P)-dependent dehydrogenase (short-subunit alcohol dehydrogenase family) [Tissierella praeacuta]SHE69182.1 NAD(P)-dependent dehydrogenase, short-chain alcohol dehydrogenase family [Tissierella praeacuta DSM 18095]SUO99107.1 3-oxoacyl-[acyl-carrier-protein] reductase FabG [Tissierella praeacuta]
MRLDEKIVLVTGASSGIGKEIALLFAKEGARVVAVARRINKLEELVNSTIGYNGIIIPFEGDVSKQEDMDKLVDYIIKNFGRIDVLVNNAGNLDNFTPVHDLSDELWENILDINLTAPMKLARKIIPFMIQAESGNIVNVASIGGLNGARGGAAYTASKFGLVGLSKNIGFMYANKGIRCNVICPGGVDTEITSNQKPNTFGVERIMSGTGNNIRSGSPEEIANIALFLASDESSLINGATIVADAGWTAY